MQSMVSASLAWLLSAHAWAAHDVGVLVWSATIPGQVAMRRGLEAEAEKINAAGDQPVLSLHTRIAGDGPKGIERQVQQMNTLIDQGVDLLIVQPTDNAALSGPLRRANAAGIPVVAYDQYITGGDLAAYITSNNRQAGTLDGEYIAHRFPNTQTIKVVLVEYPHVSSTVERLDGFLDALSAQQQPFEIVGTYKAVQPEEGRRAGQAILRDFPAPGSVDVVFTVNDGGGLAVVEALAAAGRREILVATIDGDPASVENIQDGALTVIDSAQFCGELGAEAMRQGWKVLQGQRADAHVLIPTFPITAETVDQYGGWDGSLPAAFVKPWPSSTPSWEPRLEVVSGPHP